MEPAQKIAKILRTDKDIIEKLAEKAEALTDKENILEKIVKGNEALIKNRLQLKELGSSISAEEIYKALIDKIKEDDLQLFKALGKPSFMLKEDVDFVLEKVKDLVVPAEGFFLKKEKAVEFLKKEPPQKVIDYLGYKNVDELISREDIFEIFAAIRIFEDTKWLNDVFSKQYLSLTPNDFEKRMIEMRSLSQKWVGVAQTFLKKKYQNISHLKELGYIFVIPVELGMLGEVTRMFSLALHYFFEVKFNSELFEKFASEPATFGKNFASVIKVEIIDNRPPETDKLRWLIIPRYLARYDENDWRLFEPHISPEALYWKKAEDALVNINKVLKDVYVNFLFWQDLDWVGDYFKTKTGIESLVSFNLVDAIMALIREKELEKYLYHHQESLWNKIFIEYFGEEKFEKLIKENFIKGYFEM
ncbi:hypothetical protein A2999_01575 [Candidatus Wolfebacteria bacterium RIFCSPLOWO2_01_FULL_38_11]|uniref:Glycosidase related protein n=2 Tax=Candidatus Wolfeibacteriota TaxID=1752735 RepID=A0A0G0FRQ0_9BACT|nr:MAG: hypothetical protein US36_C0015G0002 [Candidatus Wolfebacteria bacterium GW2011_GWC1_37_10]OGM92145.1 MAG: hypothetical protein A2999_01575 [Candidatus Wolfebacteria bacterium RIFCSPLOWO2_01_FULL_38_11]